jgi:hypothetical protein
MSELSNLYEKQMRWRNAAAAKVSLLSVLKMNVPLFELIGSEAQRRYAGSKRATYHFRANYIFIPFSTNISIQGNIL